MEYEVYKKFLNEIGVLDVDAHISAIRLRGKKYAGKDSLGTRLATLFRFLFERPRKIDLGKSAVVVVVSNDENSTKTAVDYIHRNEGTIEYTLIRPKRYLVGKKQGRKHIYLWFKMVWLLLLSFKYIETHTKDLLNAYKFFIFFSNSFDSIDLVYVFGRLYRIDFYLAALIASEVFKLKVKYLVGSGIIYGNKRITALPGVDFIVGSEVQIEEISSLMKAGLFSARSLEKWGSVNIVNKPLSALKQHGIGVYSSGEWARKGGLIREGDIGKIKRKEHINNKRYSLFYEILVHLAINYDDIIVYLHPFERKLLKTDGIEPPYFSFLHEHGILADVEDSDSMQRFVECEVGVTVNSTIMYERWELGCDGYMYNDPDWTDDTRLVNPMFMGKYGQYLYNSPQDLIDKLQLRDKAKRVDRIAYHPDILL